MIHRLRAMCIFESNFPSHTNCIHTFWHFPLKKQKTNYFDTFGCCCLFISFGLKMPSYAILITFGMYFYGIRYANDVHSTAHYTLSC